MVVIPPKPWPRQMDFVKRATCLLPDFDAVREALSAEPIREAAWSRRAGAVDDEFDLDGEAEPFDPLAQHDLRDMDIAQARGHLFSAVSWFLAELELYTDDVDGVVVDGVYPVQLFAVIEGYKVYGRWRDSVWGAEYNTGRLGITPEPDDNVVGHRINSRRYADWQEFPGSVPHPHVGPEWQRTAFLTLWGIRQHKASAACDADHGCCELCNACTIVVPEYVAAGRPPYELPVDDPVQRQADIAADANARDELRQLHVDLDAGCEGADTKEARREAREHKRDTLRAWGYMQDLLAERTFTLVNGPAGPQWQTDE